MIYEIAGLRVKIENQYDFTTKFCREYLSDDQTSKVDIVASVTEEEFAAERAISDEFSDGYIENICLYRSICSQIPVFNRMLLHCAVLEYDGKGYAFLGRSGTGKSTHTKLWKKYLSTPKMINGDKPILRVKDGKIYAYGTPWCGKEGWNTNTSAPLTALCFLERSPENYIHPLETAEALDRIMHQLLRPRGLEEMDLTLQFTDLLLRTVPTFVLGCNISHEAAELSFRTLTGVKGEEE